MRVLVEIAVLALLQASQAGAQQYIISTYAGGVPPATPAPGPSVSIGEPAGIASGAAGDVYFTGLNCVFKLDSNGIVTLVAGTSREGYSGNGGPATYAMLNEPAGLAVDAAGNVYIADTLNNRIRKVSTKGIITVVAGDGSQDSGSDPASSAQLSFPSGVAIDRAGNIYIADSGNNRVLRISTAGVVTTVAGNGTAGYSGDGGPATSAQLSYPNGLTLDSAGNLYIADSLNNRVRRVLVTGTIATVAGAGSRGYAGDGGLATAAQLYTPSGVAVDSAGNLYIADSLNNRIRAVSATGMITTVAGNGTTGYSADGGSATAAPVPDPKGVAIGANGSLYISSSAIRQVSAAGIIGTAAGNGSFSDSGDGGPATAAQLWDPRAVAIDATGNLYISDLSNGRIRKVSTAGIITTVAGNGSYGYSGDGGPATAAQLNSAAGIAVDSAGNLYIADSLNNRIRAVSATGMITTVAGNGTGGYSGDGGPAIHAELSGPQGVALDASGNLYIAESGNHRVRRVSTAGIITTVAGNGSPGYAGDGGMATSAQFSGPDAIASDSAGNLYVADFNNNRVRKVAVSGVITTVAGNGAMGSGGSGGPATSAQIGHPIGVAVDAAGNLYIAGALSFVWKVSIAGIATVIGDGANAVQPADGVPATESLINGAIGLTVDASGNIYVAESGGQAIRLLTPSNSPCSYSLSTTALQSPVAGGNLSLMIDTGGGCGWGIFSLPDWVIVSGPTAGSGPVAVTLAVAPNSGAPRSARISIAGITVTLNQASSTLLVNANGVVSDATYRTPVAPGSIAAVFGNFLLATPASATSLPAPTNLGGLSFQFGAGPPAPLFYANGAQVNAQIPWELAGQSQTTITPMFHGQTGAPQAVKLATYAPGIFTVNGEGFGQGAILDSNNRLVDSSNPAASGSTVLQIYCTGLGPVTNQPPTGEASPIGPLAETAVQPTVTIGGSPATVQFSGLVPGAVGLYQVNALVPSGTTRGSSVPVVISIGGVPSNTATIAVQ